MKYRTPLRPDWTHSKVVVSSALLERMSNELLFIQSMHERTTRISNHDLYLYFLWEDVKDLLPATTEYFGELQNKIRFIMLSNPNYHGKINIPHVDSYDPTVVPFALNFPIKECEGSFISFYEPIEETRKMVSAVRYRNNDALIEERQYAIMRSEDVRCVEAVEMTQPLLINTSMLHSGVVTKVGRTIASVKFKENDLPTIDDLIKIGVESPFQTTK